MQPFISIHFVICMRLKLFKSLVTNLGCSRVSVKYIMFAGDQLLEEINELNPAYDVYTWSVNVDSYCSKVSGQVI